MCCIYCLTVYEWTVYRGVLYKASISYGGGGTSFSVTFALWKGHTKILYGYYFTLYPHK